MITIYNRIWIHKKLLSVIIVLLLGVLSFTWFRGDFLIYNSDIDTPLNPSRGIVRALNVWDINDALGSHNPLVIASLIPFQVLWASLGNVFSLVTSQKIMFYLLFSGSGLSMYFLTSTLIKEKRREIASLISAIFYMLNPFSMILIWPQPTTFIFLYTFLPLLLALFIRGLERTNTFKSVFLMCLIWLLTTATAYQNPRFVIVTWTPMLLYLFFYMLTRREVIHPIQFTVTLALIWFALNAYWMLPNMVYVTEDYGEFGYEALGLSDLSAFKLNSAQIIDVMRLSGYWALSDGFKGDPYYIWATVYSSPLFLSISFFMCLFAFLPLLLRPRDKNIIFFTLLALYGSFLVKGPNPPLGEINTWVISHISFLARIFRHNYEYFGIYIPLSYAFLIGYSLVHLSNYAKIGVRGEAHRSKRLASIKNMGGILTISLIVFLLLGVYAWPFWTGDVIYPGGKVIPSSRVKIPNYYYEAGNWLNSQNEDFRILSLPMASWSSYATYWWNNGSHGYSGVNPIVWLLPKPAIVSGQSGHGLSGFIIQNWLAEAEAGFENGENYTMLSKLLTFLNVKYVSFHRDANWRFIEEHPWYISTSPESFQSVLRSQEGLQLEKSFGQLDFYRNEYWRPLHVYATTAGILIHNVGEMLEVVEENDFVPGTSVFLLSKPSNQQLPIPFTTTLASYNKNNMLIIYEKSNPTKYIVHIKASKPFFLVFSKSYHKDWVAYVDGQQIPNEYHFIGNGYANAWYINKTGTYTATLEFLPQKLFYIGSAISITTLILCTLYISKNKIKTIYKRYIKKRNSQSR